MDHDKMHETIVQELMDGDTLKRAGALGRDVHLVDLVDDEGVQYLCGADDLCNLVLHPLDSDVSGRLENKFRKLCEEWLESAYGQDYLNQRIRDHEEDARADAAEARREAKRDITEAA